MSKIREILAGFNDQALEALTSKGLLRRTRKDLESVKPSLLNETDDQINLMVEDCHVQIPGSGPAAAQCSCPATGVCRHILAAVLYVQEIGKNKFPDTFDTETDSFSEPPTEKDADSTISSLDNNNEVVMELLAYDLQQLRKWAGKVRLTKAVELLTEEVNVDTSEKLRVVVTFPSRGVRVFIIGGIGLDGIIIDGPTRDPRVEAVAAVLCCQQQFGSVPSEILNVKTEETKTFHGAIVEKSIKLMEDMVNVGLSHLSEAFSERAITAALAAVSAQLPRLSLSLRSIAEEIDLISDRVASADEGRLLRLIAQTYALCQTLSIHRENSKPDWMGQGRTVYEELDTVELNCISAYRWESKSDYHGITLVFWNEAGGEWLTWSDARPKFHSTGFDPAGRYLESAPWRVGATLQTLAKSRVELRDPRKNNQNRLSTSEKTQGRILGAVSPSAINWGTKLFSNWRQLVEYWNDSIPMGLNQYQALRDLVVIKPVDWGRRGFDPVQQEFFWPVEDEQKDSILLKVPFNSVNESSITILENLSVKAEKIWGVIGRLISQNGAVSVYPLSLLSEKPDTPVIHLTLDKTMEKPVTWITKLIQDRKSNNNVDYSEQTLDDEINSKILTSVDDLLLRLAERGVSRMALKSIEEIHNTVKEMRSRSFVVLADALDNLCRCATGKTLLPAVYITTLYHQATTKIQRNIH